MIGDRPAASTEQAERFWSEAVGRFESAAAGRLLERDLVIAGVPVRLSFAGPAMYEAVFPAFEHLAGPRAEPARRVLIWDTASTGVEPPEPIWRMSDIGPHGEVLPLGDGPIHAVANAEWGRLLGYDSRTGTLVYHASDAGAMPWHEYAAPMRSGLHWLLSGPERHLIHGAAVGERGRGLLITAPSGSGKSSLAVACFCAGLDTAADDFVVVTLDGAPRAHSLYATAKLDRRSVQLVAPDPRLITNPDFAEDEKAVLDLRSGPMVGELPISGIVVPRLTGTSAPTLERIGGAEALRQIAPSTLVVMPRPRGPAMGTAARLARELPAWRLDLGEDLAAAVDPLRGLLATEVTA